MTHCSHGVEEGGENSRRLWLAFSVIAIFMVIEVIGGVLSGSLALLADAGHMLTDAFALGLAASAQIIAMRPADSRLHFGYHRARVLAAFVNGVLLAILLAWIVVEAVQRFISPVDVEAPLMLWVAIGGLIANIVAFFILHRGDNHDVNMRGAILHVLGDLLGSVAAIIAAVVIFYTGWMRIDPILSVAVAALIGVSAFRLITETGFILLEGAPTHIDITTLQTSLRASSPFIAEVSDVRLWQLTPNHIRAAVHISVTRDEDCAIALASAKTVLRDQFSINDSTIEVCILSEPAGGVAPMPASSCAAE